MLGLEDGFFVGVLLYCDLGLRQGIFMPCPHRAERTKPGSGPALLQWLILLSGNQSSQPAPMRIEQSEVPPNAFWPTISRLSPGLANNRALALTGAAMRAPRVIWPWARDGHAAR